MYKHLSLLAMLCLFVTVAQAQSKRDSLRVYQGSEVTVEDETLNEIPKVSPTASKTNTPIRDIPASIVIVPPFVIREQGAVSLDQTIRNVSGIVQSSSSNYGFFNNYNIRGLRPKFLLNGLPDGPTINGYARTLTGIEKVEVMKGPGSALYGTTEPGGTINMVSKALYDQPTLYFSQTAGSYGAFTGTLDAGTGFDDGGIKTRLSAGYTTKTGFRNIQNKTFEFIPTARFSLGEGQALTTTIDVRSVEQGADTYGLVLKGSTKAGTEVAVPDPNVTYYTPFSSTETNIKRGILQYSYVPSENLFIRASATMFGRTLHLLRNAGGTTIDTTLSITGRSLREQWDDVTESMIQVEPIFLFKTGTMEHTFLGGFEYDHANIFTYRQSAPLKSITDKYHPVIPETSYDSLKFTKNAGNDRHILTNTIGIYGQEQVAITEQLKARVGLRYDIFGVNDVHRSEDSVTEDRSDAALSYQAGLVYQPIKELSIFGGYSIGHQSTLTTEGSRIGEPESATQIEAGLKAFLFDDRLSSTITYFTVDREHFLVTIPGEPDPVPIGAQNTHGLEFDLALKVTNGLTLTGNFAHYEAKLTNQPQDTTLVGKVPTGVPENTGAFWASYTFNDEMLKGFGFGGGMTYRSEQFFDAKNTITVPSYASFDAVVFYHHTLFDAQVNINNLTNKLFFRNAVNGGFLPAEPRNFVGTIRLKL